MEARAIRRRMAPPSCSSTRPSRITAVPLNAPCWRSISERFRLPRTLRRRPPTAIERATSNSGQCAIAHALIRGAQNARRNLRRMERIHIILGATSSRQAISCGPDQSPGYGVRRLLRCSSHLVVLSPCIIERVGWLQLGRLQPVARNRRNDGAIARSPFSAPFTCMLYGKTAALRASSTNVTLCTETQPGANGFSASGRLGVNSPPEYPTRSLSNAARGWCSLDVMWVWQRRSVVPRGVFSRERQRRYRPRTHTQADARGTSRTEDSIRSRVLCHACGSYQQRTSVRGTRSRRCHCSWLELRHAACGGWSILLDGLVPHSRRLRCARKNAAKGRRTRAILSPVYSHISYRVRASDPLSRRTASHLPIAAH